jgi:hypothetical protein
VEPGTVWPPTGEGDPEATHPYDLGPMWQARTRGRPRSVSNTTAPWSRRSLNPTGAWTIGPSATPGHRSRPGVRGVGAFSGFPAGSDAAVARTPFRPLRPPRRSSEPLAHQRSRVRRLDDSSPAELNTVE